ncbi:MAG: nicotinate-nucleotide diphosphorylase (carboxylating) [Methanomicrobiales archaeon HGW-Methanomicrobiales-3]|jgi:nicotinate-nucleotide pyrophosphorylase (carboxylating)|nr:MAG: nicotinate-nucleotide diphosphorylase (carboxylating) [Methanomicrobiales archaeon HGW-Methanomicrobiales-3]
MVTLEYLLRFIEEDAPAGDLTSDVIIPDVDTRAVIRAEEAGVVAGLTEATTLFSHFLVRVTPAKKDGDTVRPGEILLTLEGSAKRILLVERTALNIIGRMSGIATRTRALGDLVRAKKPACRIAATRKTCPGFGALDKKAVIIGGGDPHRTNLSEGFLIKDNHLALVPIPEAIRRAKAYSIYKKVEVEVESADDAVLAAESGTDIIMLDNMTAGQVADTLLRLTKAGLRDRVTVEVSGGIDEKTLAGYAASGADVISMGSLTHTVRNFSVTLEMFP